MAGKGFRYGRSRNKDRGRHPVLYQLPAGQVQTRRGVARFQSQHESQMGLQLVYRKEAKKCSSTN